MKELVRLAEANMILKPEQLQAVEEGHPVLVIVGSTECVVVRKDVFEQVQRLLGDSLDAEAIHGHIEQVMADDDVTDPLLDSYQVFKR